MIPFRCEQCRKSLKVKDELAGKKVKCPGCGSAVLVPRPAATAPRRAGPAGAADDPTLPPRASGVGGTGQASQASVSDAQAPTQTEIGPGGTSTGGPGSETYDFLAPPESPDELGRLGPYRVLQVLGAGGMGVVFRAEDPQLKRPVAIKAMLPGLAATASARQRFLREAQAAAALKHDHVVTIYQVGEDRGVPFLAMEYLEGEPLDARLERQSPLPLAEVLRIGREMAEGLAAAHERGLIHRDVKPANVWLEAPRARVKILDFGLARSTAGEAHLTQTGAIVGTPAFMSPEQAQGGAVGPRSDLFSLGCVLYCMATGQVPFKGTDPISTLMAVATQEPAAARDVNPALPQALSDLVMKLLAKAPARRSASAHEVADALRALEAGLSAAPSPTLPAGKRLTARTSAVAPRRRRPWLAVGACLAAFLGLGVGAAVIALLGGNTGTPPGPQTQATQAPALSETIAGKTEPIVPALSVFDRLRREDIPLARLTAAGRGDPKKAAKEIVAIFGDPRAKIATFVLHPDGKTLAAVVDGHVRLIDVANGKQRSWPRSVRDARHLWFSHDGKLLALGSTHDSLVPTSLWEVGTGDQAQVVDTKVGNDVQLAFSPDDRQIFWVCLGHPLRRAWTAGRVEIGAEPPARLEKASYPMQALALSPDGRFLAASSVTTYESAFVQLWDVRTGKLLGKTNDKMRGAFRLGFTPDSKRLAQVHSYVNEVPVFDVATRKRRGAFASPNTTDISFSPQGSLAATCSWSGEIRLWDTRTFANLRTLSLRPPDAGHDWGGLRQVQLTPDGRHVLTRSHDGAVYVVRLAPPPTSP